MGEVLYRDIERLSLELEIDLWDLTLEEILELLDENLLI